MSMFNVTPMGGFGPQIANSLTGVGDRLRENRQAEEAEERRKQLGRSLQVAFGDDPLAASEAMANLFENNPDIAMQVRKGLFEQAQAKTEAEQKAATQQLVDFGSRFLTASPEQKETLIQEYGSNPQFAAFTLDDKLQGLDPSAQDRLVEFAMRGAGVDGDALQSLIGMTAEPEKLSATQKEYNQAVQQGFEGTILDYHRALKEGPTTDIEQQKLKAQVDKIKSDLAQREKNEKSLEIIKDEKTKSTVQQIDRIMDNVDRALLQSNEDLTTGFSGALVGLVPGTEAYDLRSTIDSIQANLGFDRLQQMRDASPTGGALGAVSQRELDLLISAVENISPNQSQEQLQENLKRVKDHYSKWRETTLGVNPDQVSDEFQGFSIQR